MPADPEIELRLAGEGDLPAVVSFLQLCLGAGSVPRSVEFWRWKHELGPFGPSPVLLAESRGEIVGLRAFLRWRLRSGERDVEAVRAVDTATHPDWRGRGIFTRLTRELAALEAERGTAFVFNTPNHSSGPGYLKMGWRRVGKVPVLVRPVRWPRREGPALNRLPTLDTFLELPWLDELLAAVEAGRSDRRYRTAVDREYLRWRYGEIPGIEYRALWSGEGRHAVVAVARSRSRGRFRETVVSELLVPAGTESIRAAARLLGRLASESGAHYLATVASPGTPERETARQGGFFPVPLGVPSLFVRELTAVSELPDPMRLASWRFGAGSLEIF